MTHKNVYHFCLGLLLSLSAGLAYADMSIDNLPEEEPLVIMEVVKDTPSEICFQIVGEPEIHCFIKEE